MVIFYKKNWRKEGIKIFAYFDDGFGAPSPHLLNRLSTGGSRIC